MAILTGGYSYARIVGVPVPTAAGAITPRAANTVTSSNADVVIFDKIEQTQIQYAEGNATLTQLDDSEALYTFLDKYQSAGGQEPTRVRLENGDEIVAGASDQEYVVGIFLGPKDGTKRKVAVIYGIVTGSGNYNQQNNEIAKPTFQVTGAGVPFDIIVNVGGLGDIAGTKNVTIKKGKKSAIAYITIA
jgi:hypothetical protein